MTRRLASATTRDVRGYKPCCLCREFKPESAFASSKGKADGLQSRCRACNAGIYRGRSDLIRDKMREQRLNVTREQFDEMFASQGEACAICRTTTPGNRFWCVDHDHACCPQAGISCGNCIRGILCTACNQGLGNMRDDVTRLRTAADYLEGANVQGTRHSRAAITRGAS